MWGYLQAFSVLLNRQAPTSHPEKEAHDAVHTHPEIDLSECTITAKGFPRNCAKPRSKSKNKSCANKENFSCTKSERSDSL